MLKTFRKQNRTECTSLQTIDSLELYSSQNQKSFPNSEEESVIQNEEEQQPKTKTSSIIPSLERPKDEATCITVCGTPQVVNNCFEETREQGTMAEHQYPRDSIDIDNNAKAVTDSETNHSKSTYMETNKRELTDMNTNQRETTDMNTNQRETTDLNTNQRETIDMDGSSKETTYMDSNTREVTDMNCNEIDSTTVNIRQVEQMTAFAYLKDNEAGDNNPNKEREVTAVVSNQREATESIENHVCHICQKSFKLKRYLYSHMKRHADVRKFSCEICGFKFMEKNKMKLHMESHKSKEMRNLPYKCEICCHQFYNKAGYDDHMNTHTGLSLNFTLVEIFTISTKKYDTVSSSKK